MAEVSIDASTAMKTVRAMDRNCLLILSNSETTSSLQSGKSEYQIEPFEHGYGLIESMSVVGGPGLKLTASFQDRLRVADGVKSRLLISHCTYPFKKWQQCNAIEKSSQL